MSDRGLLIMLVWALCPLGFEALARDWHFLFINASLLVFGGAAGAGSGPAFRALENWKFDRDRDRGKRKMATVKKGILTAALHFSYDRHLRAWGKRWFWHRERKAGKQAAKREA